MSFQEASGYCPTCARYVLVRRSAPNHLAHLIATIFLCGFWAIPWMLFVIFRDAWKCAYCGSAGVYGIKGGGTLGVALGILTIGVGAACALGLLLWLGAR